MERNRGMKGAHFKNNSYCTGWPKKKVAHQTYVSLNGTSCILLYIWIIFYIIDLSRTRHDMSNYNGF